MPATPVSEGPAALLVHNRTDTVNCRQLCTAVLSPGMEGSRHIPQRGLPG